MTFWLSPINRAVPNSLWVVLLAIIVIGIKLYLSNFFIYPSLFGVVLLQHWYVENIMNSLVPKNL